MKVIEISKSEGERAMALWKEREWKLKGKYMYEGRCGRFVGIDNGNGICRVAVFLDKESCKEWLQIEKQVKDIRGQGIYMSRSDGNELMKMKRNSAYWFNAEGF